MEMNAAKVFQHKIFRGKPSFVDKKMDEKSRFGELSTEEMTRNRGQCRPSNNKKSLKVQDEII